MKRNMTFLAPAVLLLLLSACGGGGNESVAAGDRLAELPENASQSSAAMARYMGALAAMPSESREPVAIENFNPPRPDDTEPEPVGG